MPSLKIACLGAGYVGGPTLVVMAKKVPDSKFYILDINQKRIDQWNSAELPIFEPGLQELVEECRGKNLFFSTDIETHISDCDIVFVSVSTPTKISGIGRGRAADLANWESAGRMIAKYAVGPKIVVEKSTVPVRTAETLAAVLDARNDLNNQFVVLSNPEFLAEGTAINDLLFPDRILIGGDRSTRGATASQTLADLYSCWVPKERILTTNIWSAELSKLVANAFLAQRISSINSVSMICAKTGADVREVSKAVGGDSRVGSKFLNASVGFGGSCFKKDVLNLCYICETMGLKEVADYWHGVVAMNELQKSQFANNIVQTMFQNLRRKKIAMFGFAFKKDTGDVRETPAVEVCQILFDEGANVHVFDPKVLEEDARAELQEHGVTVPLSSLVFSRKVEDAVLGAHAIVIMTEWDCFRTYDYKTFRIQMENPAFVFDGRNLLTDLDLQSLGFQYQGVGV